MEYIYLLSIAIILLSTKILGDITNRVHLTQVVGALLAGVIIGPSCLGWIDESQFIDQTAEIGVIILMFMAGLDTDVKELKKHSISCVVIALIGVIVPLIGGFTAYYFYYSNGSTGYTEILKAVFIGVILTATSVSITVEALREMGKLEGKVGSTIMGAAVIDDIMGIVVLTIVLSLEDPDVSIAKVLAQIVAYGVLMVVLALVVRKCRPLIDKNIHHRRITTYVLAACLIISFVSEAGFGVADITGAYLLGLFLSGCQIKKEVGRKLSPVSYLFFSPIFFASIGLKVSLDGIDSRLWIFSLILIVIACLTKIIGCGLGALLCKYTPSESLKIGVGMISRGEVALIVAQKGYAIGLVDQSMFPAIVIVVIVTTIVTPVALKRLMD